ncbi:adenosylmethionine decarboxylase [Metabacillus iocasae]|uniref:S-adenosylmethionine decarboxylase proenzyme n=1 Tax=Priestia iocasae TaxID=2291674 RepID=A0ABS2QVJ7_9BACI|nr:adenosylmethionine decarboxylase [Metabacillus iocasae]MBM7703298.1 spermidine synthase [Metabacillus iocasae]
MEINGHHMVVDAFSCNPSVLNDIQRLEELLLQITKTLHMEVLHTHFHQFHPEGITGVIVLGTSHFSIHTWPEEGYAALDLYTCGDGNPMTEITTLLEGLESNYANVYYLPRGEKQKQQISSTILDTRKDEGGETNVE